MMNSCFKISLSKKRKVCIFWNVINEYDCQLRTLFDRVKHVMAIEQTLIPNNHTFIVVH